MTDIDLTELTERRDELVVLDVRALWEFDGSYGNDCCRRQGHIPGAIHFDVQELLTMGEVEVRERLGLPEGTEVVAYCHSGSRSQMATQALQALGFNARNYRGSWHEYAASDLPLEI